MCIRDRFDRFVEIFGIRFYGKGDIASADSIKE